MTSNKISKQKFKITNEGFVYGIMFSVFFWGLFLTLFNYHIHNPSCLSSYFLGVFVILNGISIAVLFDYWSRK